MSLVSAGLAVGPIALLVWLTLGLTKNRPVVIVAALSLRAGPRLFEDPLCSLRGLIVTDVVVLDTELLVSYRDGHGTWCILDPGHDQGRVVCDLQQAEGQLHFPLLAQEPRALRLLDRWQRQAQPLVSIVSRNREALCLVEEGTRSVIVDALTLR